MPPSPIATTLAYAAFELRRTLRDPQVAIFLGFPVVLYPTLIWGMTELGQLEKGRHDHEIYTVATLPSPPPPHGVLPLPPLTGDRLEAVEGDLAALEAGEVDVVVARDGSQVQVHHLPARPRSARAAERVTERLKTLHHDALVEAVTARGGDPEALEPYTLDDVFLGDRSELTGWILGLLVGAIGPLAMLLAGVYPAIDLFVVERERDTLETLLVSAVPRSIAVGGKLLACAGLVFVAALANLGALGLSAVHVTALLLGAEALGGLPGPLTWLLAVGALASASLLFATLMMAAVVPARTYKEAEWITTTVLFGSFPLLAFALLGIMQGDVPEGLWAVPFAHTVIAIASAPTGELTALRALVTIGTDLAATVALLALLWRTPGPTALLAGGWRPPWLDRLMGSP